MSRPATRNTNESGDVYQEIVEDLRELRKENPTNYGYLVRRWEDVQEGIERTAQNYPNAKQIHGTIDDPDAEPRSIGPALKALVSLDIIGIWSDSVGANRYDLTTYDPERAAALGTVLDE